MEDFRKLQKAIIDLVLKVTDFKKLEYIYRFIKRYLD